MVVATTVPMFEFLHQTANLLLSGHASIGEEVENVNLLTLLIHPQTVTVVGGENLLRA